MARKVILPALMAGLLLAAACTSTGQTERRAATGAAVGALAGAVIVNNTGDGDAGDGAAIGAVIGGVAGAAQGCYEALDCDVPGVNDPYDPSYSNRRTY
ncbi:MAG: YMGG-like glycine zipper-containing protein [Pseudomonadota bacterium]